MAKIVERALAFEKEADVLHQKVLYLQDCINMGQSCEDVSKAYAKVAFEFGVFAQICKDLKSECWNGAYTFNMEFDI